MNKKESVHEKAIRMIEGGIIDIEGHAVRLIREPYIFDPCLCCEMDSLCHIDSEMCNVCKECDFITGDDCFLTFAYTKNQ